MSGKNRGIQIASGVIVAAGLVLLVLNIILAGKIDFTLPILFLTLGSAFILLVFAMRERWKYAPVFYIPGGLFLAFGVIFLLNVLTGDWQAWAYSWFFLLTGLGVGTVLAAMYIPLRKEILFGGLWTTVGSITLLAVFGAIAGGWVIRVLAPILLVTAGLVLRYWHSGRLPTLLFRAEQPAQVPPAQNEPMLENGGKANNTLPEPLSARELEVLQLIYQGYNNQEIAEKLTVAPSTVKTHINNIYGKLGVQTRGQCIAAARNLKLV